MSAGAVVPKFGMLSTVAELGSAFEAGLPPFLPFWRFLIRLAFWTSQLSIRYLLSSLTMRPDDRKDSTRLIMGTSGSRWFR